MVQPLPVVFIETLAAMNDNAPIRPLVEVIHPVPSNVDIVRVRQVRLHCRLALAGMDIDIRYRATHGHGNGLQL